MIFFNSVRHYFERHGYHVSSRLADRLGMRAQNVRLFFIYISFVTVGLSFGFYLTMAFLLKLKDMIWFSIFISKKLILDPFISYFR